MEQQIILAMYSGGLDSLGMIYKLLTDPEYKDYVLHIHHVHVHVGWKWLYKYIHVNQNTYPTIDIIHVRQLFGYQHLQA